MKATKTAAGEGRHVTTPTPILSKFSISFFKISISRKTKFVQKQKKEKKEYKCREKDGKYFIIWHLSSPSWDKYKFLTGEGASPPFRPLPQDGDPPALICHPPLPKSVSLHGYMGLGDGDSISPSLFSLSVFCTAVTIFNVMLSAYTYLYSHQMTYHNRLWMDPGRCSFRQGPPCSTHCSSNPSSSIPHTMLSELKKNKHHEMSASCVKGQSCFRYQVNVSSC